MILGESLMILEFNDTLPAIAYPNYFITFKSYLDNKL